MSTRFGRFSVLALALALGAGALAYVSAKAGAASAYKGPPAAPVIAVVDLEGVLGGLNERKDKESALKTSLEDMQKRVTALGDEAKGEQSKVEQATGAQKIALAKAMREKIIRAEFEKQYSEKVLGEMQGEMLRELYLKIDEAAGRLAKQNGYQLVLASDEKVNIPQGAPGEVLRAIALKRMLYVDQSLDITQEIVALMNNEYAAKK